MRGLSKIRRRQKRVVFDLSTNQFNLSDFAIVSPSATFSILNGNLRLTGGAGNFLNSISYNKLDKNLFTVNTSEEWQITVRFSVDAIAGNTFGCSIGLLSNQTERIDCAVRLALDTGGPLGRWYLYRVLNGNPNQVTSGTAFTLTANTQYIQRITRSRYAITCELLDSNNNLLTSSTITYNLATANQFFLPNTGRFGIYHNGGSITISQWRVEILDNRDVDIAFLGDSNMAGLYVANPDNRYTEQIAANKSWTRAIFAGTGATTESALTMLETLYECSPRRVYINLGSNDIAQNLTGFQDRYREIIRRLKLRGYQVYHGVPVARNGISFAAYRTFLQTEYPSDLVVDLWDLTRTGLNLNATYNSGDGIHLNLAGNNIIASTIIPLLT